MAEWRNGRKNRRMAEWRNGGMSDWQNGGLAEWQKESQNGRMAEWRNCGMAEWRNGGMAEWRDCGMAERRKGEMAEWRNCGIAKWRNGGMGELPAEWRNDGMIIVVIIALARMCEGTSHFLSASKMWKIIAWECGSCGKTNEVMSRRHCHICGMPRPVRYYIIAGPIEPDYGRRWFGTAANPINEEVFDAYGEVRLTCNSTDPSPALSSITTSAFQSTVETQNGVNNIDDLNN